VLEVFFVGGAHYCCFDRTIGCVMSGNGDFKESKKNGTLLFWWNADGVRWCDEWERSEKT